MGYRQPNYRKKRNNRRRSQYPSSGYERAQEHILQAEQLTKELGGTDQDVKIYLFSLDNQQMQEILDIYENKYGSTARKYAEQTIPKWRSGKVQMSGMVAERLYNLLPPIMPIEQKYKLAESLWRYVAPSSTRYVYFGQDVDIKELSALVGEHFINKATTHHIPENIQLRFNWLASGDVNLKQELLNYFMDKERELVAQEIHEKLEILINTFKSKGSNDFFKANINLSVGKHTIHIVFNERVQGMSDSIPPQKSSPSESWIIYLAIAAFLLFLWVLNQQQTY
ncbi:MAG: hypothetical protein JJT87_12535 [Halomonas sp.]|nr:hypothetical protein [Halomonas sp.]MCC5902737.1 hypothetical protein [Halomonas sp.]